MWESMERTRNLKIIIRKGVKITICKGSPASAATTLNSSGSNKTD
jgi:hypothetical protein